MRYKQFLLVICMLNGFYLFCQDSSFANSGGTTVITLFTNDTIWMAADSKRSLIENNKTVGYEYLLKINEYKKVFYAVAGAYVTFKNEKKELVFDVVEVIKNGIDKGGNFDSIVKNSGVAITSALNKLYPKFPSGTKWVLKSKQGRKLLEIIMVSNLGGMLRYESIDIGIINKNGRFEFNFIGLNLEKFNPPQSVIGYRQEIYKYVSSPEYYLIDQSNKKNLLTKLIEKEASVNQGVGGTVDVVAIFKKGRKWLTNNKY